MRRDDFICKGIIIYIKVIELGKGEMKILVTWNQSFAIPILNFFIVMQMGELSATGHLTTRSFYSEGRHCYVQC